MVLTSILSATVARKNWHWNKLFVGLMLVAFLCIDIPLFSANLDKIVSGGWLPLSLGDGDVYGDDDLGRASVSACCAGCTSMATRWKR